MVVYKKDGCMQIKKHFSFRSPMVNLMSDMSSHHEYVLVVASGVSAFLQLVPGQREEK